LLIMAFNPDTARLQRIPETALGNFLFFIPITYLYIHTPIHHHINKSGNLKILDWSLIIFNLCLIPVFDLIILEPVFWVLLVVLPSIFGRLIVTWYVRENGSEEGF